MGKNFTFKILRQQARRTRIRDANNLFSIDIIPILIILHPTFILFPFSFTLCPYQFQNRA
jgi:hypothetical protein